MIKIFDNINQKKKLKKENQKNELEKIERIINKNFRKSFINKKVNNNKENSPYRIMVLGDDDTGKSYEINNFIDELIEEKLLNQKKIRRINFSSVGFEKKEEVLYLIRGFGNFERNIWRYIRNIAIPLIVFATTLLSTFFLSGIMLPIWIFITLFYFLPIIPIFIYLIWIFYKNIKYKKSNKWLIFEDVNRLSINTDINHFNILWSTVNEKELSDVNIIYEFSTNENMNETQINNLIDPRFVTHYKIIKRKRFFQKNKKSVVNKYS